MCAFSFLMAIDHRQGWDRTVKGELANTQFALLEQHEVLAYGN